MDIGSLACATFWQSAIGLVTLVHPTGVCRIFAP